jgi:hypothetical protein
MTGLNGSDDNAMFIESPAGNNLLVHPAEHARWNLQEGVVKWFEVKATA